MLLSGGLAGILVTPPSSKLYMACTKVRLSVVLKHASRVVWGCSMRLVF